MLAALGFPDPREDQGFRYCKGSIRDTIRV